MRDGGERVARAEKEMDEFVAAEVEGGVDRVNSSCNVVEGFVANDFEALGMAMLTDLFHGMGRGETNVADIFNHVFNRVPDLVFECIDNLVFDEAFHDIRDVFELLDG